MKSKNGIITAGVSGLFAVVLILMLRFVDVEPIGPENTSIGLSKLNQSVFGFFGVNMLWYRITDWLGIIAVVTAFIFAVAGFVQLVKRKSLLKVDREILALGGLYLAVIGLYVLFENLIVNYRPIIMPGCTRPEASFPSSHTMLVCVIMGSAAMLVGKYVKQKNLCNVILILCYTIIGVTVIGRLVSGVHWFTDIVGGILISITLLSVFRLIMEE